ncbi:dihydrolipoyl dehydrogenase family protein [Miltoncostaea oceani]|uniref:dihydrolipoyl dehydrogenase family protein n=1 Tax=Miltoncostaea oceani TaxID=2843216 RepID=UPI001C3C75A0|nr:NAD(P)/FAD-dependent oxidoreductase [Miltoncostaea oceani]
MPQRDGDHDAIVIGAGAGGLTVAAGLAALGRRVALVEAGRIGGDCTNVGCIPSKRLLHLSRDPALRADPPALLAAVRATRDGLAAREDDEVTTTEGIDVVRGRAALAPGRRVTVTGGDGVRVLTAPHVVIATGSRPRVLAVPGLPAGRLLTNETIFDLADAPRHLAIVGAGAVGVEMAVAFARIGSRVTLVDTADRVLPDAEPEASGALAAALVEQGVVIRLRTRVVAADPATGDLRTDGGAPLHAVDAVLAAVGREPNVGDVAAAVAVVPGGVRVDAWGRTSAPGVWAVGDVTPVAHQTHAANAHGRRIVQAIALPWIPRIGRPPSIPSAVFTEPEVAWVGPTAPERARRCHPRALIDLRVDLAGTDRGLTDGVTRGFVAVTAVRLTGRIVAATVVGPHAADLLPLLTLAIDRRISLLRIQRMVHAYPTHAAAIGAVADAFARRTLPHLPGEALAYGRHRFARSPAGRRHRTT